MKCPHFIDYTRECITEIEFLPRDTFQYCQSNKFVKCPFFIMKGAQRGVICRYLDKCSFFRNFSLEDFKNFTDLAGRFCCTKNHNNCKRYQLKEKMDPIPDELLPE